MENLELILYKVDELKKDIKDVSKEIKNIGTNGCYVGKSNKKDIILIKEDVKSLEERPQKTIVFLSVCLGLLVTVGCIFIYFHNTLPKKQTQNISNITP